MKKKFIPLLFFFCSSSYCLQGNLKLQLLNIQTTRFLEHLMNELFQTVDFWTEKARERNPEIAEKSIASSDKFLEYLEFFIIEQKINLKSVKWLADTINLDTSIIADCKYIQPFVLKYKAESGTPVYIRGDSHGDIQSLSKFFSKLKEEGVINNNFHIKDPKTLFIFLGDLTDRGKHGIDTLTLLFIFAKKNPQQVFLVRGNHESLEVIQRYGFIEEINSSFDEQNANKARQLICCFFNLLPCAAFVACSNNYFQFCHGGFELRYNPLKLISSSETVCFEFIQILNLDKKIIDTDIIAKEFDRLKISTENLNAINKELISIQKGQVEPGNLGFLWSDFNAPINILSDTDITRASKR